MSKPKIAWVYYGGTALSGGDVAIAAKFDIVTLPANSNFASTAAALRVLNPACKVLLYINWSMVGAGYAASPTPWLQQVSRENWLLRQSPASNANSPILTSYTGGTTGVNTVATNVAKVGPVSGLKPAAWYVANVVPTLPGVAAADGFFLDDATLGPNQDKATVLDAPLSGTCGVGTGASLIVDLSKSWASMLNRLVRIVTGAAAGQVAWVGSNTGTTLVPAFPFSPAPSSGDAYEVYTYSAQITATTSAINADYTETGVPLNFDSLTWKAAIATEKIEGINMLLEAYPNALIVANDGRGFYCPQSANLNRERVGVFYEGTIGSAYQVGWRTAMSQLQGLARRLSPNLCIVAGFASSASDWAKTRYIMSAGILGGGLAQTNVSYSETTPIYLDEYNIDMGEPAGDTTRNADGTYYREFTQAYVLVNPTASIINGVQVPAGFRRILASDYANQDPTLNDGLATPMNLAASSAVMFVRA